MKLTNKTLTYIFSIILIALIITLYFYIKTGDEEIVYSNNYSNKVTNNSIINHEKNENNSSNKTTNNTGKISAKDYQKIPVNEVTDYSAFFTINNLMNSYYNNINKKEYDDLVLKLDNNYLKNNSLNIENIKNIYDNINGEAAFFLKKAYYKDTDDMIYYFIDGEVIYHDEITNIVELIASNKFVIGLLKLNDSYQIYPISSDVEIKTICQEYNLLNISNNKDNRAFFDYEEVSDERIIRYYLSYYANYLYLNTEDAFNMLDDNTRNSFGTLENFNNNLDTICSYFNSDFTGYSINGINGKRTFTIEGKIKKIIIKENQIMNFQIIF